jgi:pSer/pThr/pTyr-binding forkhead associated (FHA) protein
VAVSPDGRPGGVFDLDGEVVCGRTEGTIRLADDATVSPRHARFSATGGGLRVEDLGSLNGTFLRLRMPHRVEPGDEVRIGRQLLRVEPLAPPVAEDRAARPWGGLDGGARLRLVQLLEGGGAGEAFLLPPGERTIGREAGYVTFPADRYVSARHARIVVTADGAILSDAGSSNGTFVRISAVTELRTGDEVLVGGQLLRVEG